MAKKYILFFIVVAITFGFTALYFKAKQNNSSIPTVVQNIVQPMPTDRLQLAYLQNRSYTGSDLKIEQTLNVDTNYKRYIASYYSDGLKIYGLLTVPVDQRPASGWPAIIFNHGYITPQLYTPDGNYIAYVDYFSSHGYIVFKPDYRGHGKSQGDPTSAYFSSDYNVDDLNAIASIKKYDEVNPDRIGVWGHSMGGHITLVDMVVSRDIKAAVIWGGVVGSYEDILYNWQGKVSYHPDVEDLRLRNLHSADLIAKYGTPMQNPKFWNSVDPTANLNFASAPLQIHVGLADNQVPPEFSESLYNKLKSLGKTVELYEYPGADHNIGGASFGLAMKRSVAFFDKYLKD